MISTILYTILYRINIPKSLVVGLYQLLIIEIVESLIIKKSIMDVKIVLIIKMKSTLIIKIPTIFQKAFLAIARASEMGFLSSPIL